ncbi:MAG: MFS transporter [Chloroflexota bacterium]
MARPTRLESLVLLAVFGAGVFLAGLELMITAVALPAIVIDLADWTRLREASWIVNGYLLVYIVAMPLAGRMADLWGSRRLFMAALVVFTFGSLLAGRAQTLEELIAARLLQAAGGGVLVPVGTAAASHLFEGTARPRALGIIGALTFLGMAIGPFIGAAILGTLHPEAALSRFGMASTDPLAEGLMPAWRYVFYVNVPIGILALILAWAAGAGWETPRRSGRLDIAGAIVFSVALVAGLGAVTLIGTTDAPGLPVDPQLLMAVLAIVAVVASALVIARSLTTRDPFLDVRLFRRLPFASASLVSLLTGYGFLTAIVGGAVFVDRVLYGGPADQRLALGALALATAIGALASGFAIRLLPLRVVSVLGLSASAIALWRMASWQRTSSIEEIALVLAVFGLGFGLTVTPRSTAAVESAGPESFGAASATVTVARHIGMAVGLAILTAYGSTTIDRLSTEIYTTPNAYKQYIPVELRDRPLRDGLVVEALETWASGEAARVMVGIVGVAAVLTLLAIPPALALDRRRRDPRAGTVAAGGDGRPRDDATEASLAL